MREQTSEHADGRQRTDAALLKAVQTNLPQLEIVLAEFHDAYEDGLYRFYHRSFKVYSLQNCTLRAREVFRTIGSATNNQLCELFEAIVTRGTGIKFELNHNEDWLFHTRYIIEAFFHAKYFLEMMVESARNMDSAPGVLPSGWAAILELYNQR